MRFSPVQQKAIDIRDKNVLVFASAGSGKTSVLVQRLCKLVTEDRVSIDTILAMTFTNDAANEMKTRLKIALEACEQTPYIKEQLALLETASLCTIDSFCFGIVQNYYYRIPITYTMSKTVGDDALLKDAFEQAYKKACSSIDPASMANLNFYFSNLGKNEDDIQKMLRSLIDTAWSKPEPEKWVDSLVQKNKDIDTWFFKFFKDRILCMIEILDLIGDDELEPKKSCLKTCLDYIDKQDYDAFRSAFIIALTTTPKLKNKYGDNDCKELKSDFTDIEKSIHSLLFKSEHYEQTMPEPIALFCELALKIQALYKEEKRKREILDFGDMEHFAYELLCNEDIAKEVQEKYTYILVDEFQDTNDLQESIISCFCRKNNVFRVGDIKQSIYGFRHAKPDIMKSHMDRQDEYSCTLILDENYRSNASIIEFNNDFYKKIMNVKGMPSQFDQKDFAYAGTTFQKECPQYPVRFLYSEYETQTFDPDIQKLQAKSLLNENKLDQIALDILKHIDNGYSFKDICILTRSHSPQQAIKEALEAYGIPVLAEINHGFYTNHAVQIILSALKAILDPYDDIALCAVLLSPLCNTSTRDLAKIALTKEKGSSLYKALQDSEALRSFEEIRRYRKQNLPELIRSLYLHNSFYEMHTTKQDKTNLDRFLQVASLFSDTQDIQSFVKNHDQASLLDSIGEAYPYGKDADVVSIKTMHHSKGLQFPVVYIYSQNQSQDRVSSSPILIDEKLGIGWMQMDPSNRIKTRSKAHIAIGAKKHQDELEEEMRIFYVATTRAQKELILVDTIKNANNYQAPLSLYTLMKQTSYTGWIFHTYRPGDLIKYEKCNTLFERPKGTQSKKTVKALNKYSKSFVSFTNKTASSNKASTWPQIQLKPRTGSLRGTLFHELVAQLEYPYQKGQILSYGKRKGFTLNETSVQQILALNSNPQYQQFMNLKHQFEVPYVVQMGNEVAHGYMDLVVWSDKVVVIDFKTDHLDKEEDFIHQYKEQLKTYAKAMQKIEEKEVEAWIYSFYKNTFIPIEY